MFDSNNSYEPIVRSYATQQQNRNNKLFSNEDELLICELAKEKLMAYQIACKFNTTAHRIKMICESHGVEVISKDNQKNKRTKQVLALLQNGYTTQQILNKVDCDREMIAQVRHRFGFSTPPTAAQERTMKAYKEARKMTDNGKTVVEACKMVGISTATYGKYKKASVVS